MPLKHFLVIKENVTVLDLLEVADRTDLDTHTRRERAKNGKQ